MNLSNGVDLVKVSRIEDIIKKSGDSFLNRIFTKSEISYIDSRNRSPQTIAGIFAAKEAISKALGSGIGKVAWKDMEINHNKNGKPQVTLYGRALEVFQQVGADKIHISISHEKEYALAFALLDGQYDYAHIELPEDIRAILPKRDKYSHKGSFGRLGIIAGSTGMTGAVYLSAMAALRAGSGLVYTIVPKGIGDILSIKLIEAIIKPVEDCGAGHFTKDSYSQIKDIMQAMDVLALGPGLGLDQDRIELVRRILVDYQGPIVVDADGINCLSAGGMASILKDRKGATILTPHLGELSRFLNISIEKIKRDLMGYCKYICEKYNVIMVAKTANTVVSNADGRLYVNPTGNPGMATAGSGDLLTGMIASFIGQGIEAYNATILGVYCHGLAGDLAGMDRGQYGMISRDILENIPYSIKNIPYGIKNLKYKKFK